MSVRKPLVLTADEIEAWCVESFKGLGATVRSSVPRHRAVQIGACPAARSDRRFGRSALIGPDDTAPPRSYWLVAFSVLFALTFSAWIFIG